MFWFQKTNLIRSGLLAGMTDVHSHLLPGVDDGIQTFEEAEEAVRFLEQLGVRRMMLTPHVMEDYVSNTADTLTARFAEFQRCVASSIHFTLAAEYMLDAAFQKHRSEELLLLGKRRILVETSIDEWRGVFYNKTNLKFDFCRKELPPCIRMLRPLCG